MSFQREIVEGADEAIFVLVLDPVIDPEFEI